MHVVFVTRSYWPAIGGIERLVMELGRVLLAEHEVSVVVQRVDVGHHGRMTHLLREAPSFAPFVHEGVAVRQFRLPRARRLALLPFAVELLPLASRLSLRAARRYTFRYYEMIVRPVLAALLTDADVVHAQGGDLLAAATVSVAHRLERPVVITPSAHPGEWGLDAASVQAYRRADAVVATSQSDAAVYRGVGVAEERIHVYGNPVAEIQAAEPIAFPGVDEHAPVVLFVGRRAPNKGADVLLRAAQLVWKQRPEARFAFLGPGSALPSSDPRILDVGPVSDDLRTRWFARADILCLPSASEAFGIVVLEAWSRGLPVVASDIPVLRELVSAAGGGLLAPRSPAGVAAALCRLLDDPDLARRMGAAGREEWASRYEPRIVARRHVELYERLLGGLSADPPAPDGSPASSGSSIGMAPAD